VGAPVVDAESVVRATPAVTSITDSTCIGVYFFPTSIQPKSMLTINPPLLNMMWTDMGMRYTNAALLSSEIK